MAKYRVISIDGGGIRGLVTTILLQRIVATPGLEKFLDTIDLIAVWHPAPTRHPAPTHLSQHSLLPADAARGRMIASPKRAQESML